jgi:peptidoglycan/LPS O-acetylase OafA/YrhL
MKLVRQRTTPVPPQKLLGLEIVRFGAAIAVVFWHYQNFWWTPIGLVGYVREAQPLYRCFAVLYGFGLYGVQVFWSISGYIFFWKYREALAARRISGKSFFWLRFSRLYPLHLATLVLVTGLQMIYVHLKGVPFVYENDDLFHFVLQLLMASNWSPFSPPSFNGPIWSVSVEILVYVLFSLVLRYLGSSLMWSAIIIVGAASAYLVTNHFPILQCIVCFYVGGMTATLAGLPACQRHRRLFGIIAIILLIGVPVLGKTFDLFKSESLAKIAATAYIAVLLYFMGNHFKLTSRFDSAIQAAGNMTYSSYLIHFPLQLCIAIVCTIAGWSIPKELAAFFWLYMGSILILATLIFRWFEMPCQKFIRDNFDRPAPVDHVDPPDAEAKA